MTAQLGLQWRPSQSISYYNYYYGNLEAGDYPESDPTTLSAKQYYGGLPYVTSTGGSLYNMAHYLTNGNVLDIDALMDAWGIEGELDATETNRILSSLSVQCSGSTYWAWSRVTPALDYHWTSNIIPRPRTGAITGATYTSGIVAVGNYDVNKCRENNPITSYAAADGASTKDICVANGVDAMYNAYAQVKPGDGFVFWYTSTDAGHAMMAASCAYKADGSPLTNPADANGNCYIYIFSQVDDWRESDRNGVIYQTGTNYNGAEAGKLDAEWSTGYRVVKYTFNYLYNTNGALPFTLDVFEDPSKLEDAKLYSTTNLKDGIRYTLADLANTKIDSNYPIASVNIAVKDLAGNVVDTLYVYTRWAGAYNNYSFQFTRSDSNLTNWSAVANKLANYYGYTLEVSATVGTGETLYVGTVTLIQNNLAGDIAAIPVADSSMSASQLRQIVLRTMSAQLTFQWTLDEEVSYDYKDGENKHVSLVPGTVYGGYRYVSSSNEGFEGATTGNPYIWIQQLDFSKEVPTLSVSKMEEILGDGDLSTSIEWIPAVMNQCTGTPFWAWSRVTGTLTGGYSNEFVPLNGFLTVVPEPTREYYDSDEAFETALEKWNYLVNVEKDFKRIDKYNTEGGKRTDTTLHNMAGVDPLTGKTVSGGNIERILYCRAFGRELMYKTYSLCQPGDGALYGHDVMVYQVNTVYNKDGSINGAESTIIFIDQAQKDGFVHNGVDYESASPGILVGASAKLEFTFEKLYEMGTLPFTLEVFQNPSKVETAQIVYGNENTNFADGAVLTVTELLAKKVDANYPIAYITAEFEDGTTASAYSTVPAGWGNSPLTISTNMRGVTYFASELNKHIGETVVITAQLGSGEIKHVANITLKAE